MLGVATYLAKKTVKWLIAVPTALTLECLASYMIMNESKQSQDK